MKTNRKRIALRQWAALRRAERLVDARSIATILAKGLCLGLLAAGFASHAVAASEDAAQGSSPGRPLSARDGSAHEGAAASSPVETLPVAAHRPKRADFERERASRDARQTADWVLDSGDNRGLPFVIVDKTDAKVFVFGADGRLRGAAPALLGMARGDDSVPGIGEREMSDIRPEERTTPAGRFVAALGRNFSGKDILWVDYDLALSLHRVVTAKPKERRAERLATPTPLDNRISYGCINVPVNFYEHVVTPAFTGTNGIVYVLPETRSAREVFASYDVEEEHARLQAARQPVSAQIPTAAAPI